MRETMIATMSAYPRSSLTTSVAKPDTSRRFVGTHATIRDNLQLDRVGID